MDRREFLSVLGLGLISCNDDDEMSALKARNEYRDNVIFEGGCYPAPSSDRTFGLIVNETFAGLSSIPSAYVDTGCSPTFDGTKMLIGALGAPATTMAQRIEYNYYQNFEQFYTEYTFILNYTSAAGITEESIGVIKRATGSNSFGNRSVIASWRTDTSVPNARYIKIRAGTNATSYTTWTNVASSNNKIVPVNGNKYTMSLTRTIGTIGSVYTAKLTDNTAGTFEICTWEENFGDSSGINFGNAVSRPVIGTARGSVDIYKWQFMGNDEKNRNLLILGDSISHGLLASSYEKVWFKDFNNCAAATGPNNTTQDILDMISNAIAYLPKKVILFVGTNDVVNSVAQATREANYTSIVNQLEAAGIEVILCTALPRTSANNIFLNWNPFIKTLARAKGRKLIDFFDVAVGKGSGTDASNTSLFPDGTHPSDIMHGYMRDAAKEVLGRVI